MTAAELHKRLAGRILAGEAECLRRGGEGLCISAFNAEVCRRLMETGCSEGGTVSSDAVAGLETELQNYLDRYMPDRPEGHKWIILACLYLTFVEGLPMHPREAVGWEDRDGRYFCPSRVPESAICRCCRCESTEDAPSADRAREAPPRPER